MNINNNWIDWPEKELYNKNIKDSWKIFPFYGFDKWIDKNCKRCPTIYNFIKTIIIPGGILETSGINIENTPVPCSSLETYGILSNVVSCVKEFLGKSEDGKIIYMKFNIYFKP